jgi:sigma-B regulation protein RsbU (phosphoserine phosphatase)
LGERLLELRIPARPSALKTVRKALKECLEGVGCSETGAQDIVLAVDEACQNVIRHAYGPRRGGDMVLSVDRHGPELVFSLVDYAPRIDPSRVQPRDLGDVRPGGLGTHLIQEVMDSAEFVEPPPGCGNLLRMVKRID